MDLLKAFFAGFLSTMLFHQGVLFALNRAGATAMAAWNMAGVAPLGIPAVVSIAFFGGLWGIVLWALIRGFKGTRYWVSALVLGAVLPTLVALLIVFPLKHLEFAAGWDPKIWIGALIVNGVWGLGVALLMRAFTRAVPA